MPTLKLPKRRPAPEPLVLDLSIAPGLCSLAANQGENWCATHQANWWIGQAVCDGMLARREKIATRR